MLIPLRTCLITMVTVCWLSSLAWWGSNGCTYDITRQVIFTRLKFYIVLDKRNKQFIIKIWLMPYYKYQFYSCVLLVQRRADSLFSVRLNWKRGLARNGQVNNVQRFILFTGIFLDYEKGGELRTKSIDLLDLTPEWVWLYIKK